MQNVQAAQRMIDDANIDVFKFGITADGDRKSLLSIQNIVRRVRPGYTYIEIGSDAGGSLYTHLLDSKCDLVISVDLRPGAQPDERGVSFDYGGNNTTANMIANLEQYLPLGCMLKLRTFDIDAADLPDSTPRFDLGFIDGEHTNRAAFQDFLSLYKFAKKDCVILWHDSNLVTDAIANAESFLRFHKVRFETLLLPDVVGAIFIGDYLEHSQSIKRFAYDKQEFFRGAKEDLWKMIAQSRGSAS